MGAAAATSSRRASALGSLRIAYLVLVGLYLVAMAWVWAGVVHSAGGRYIGLLPLQALGFAAAGGILSVVVFPHLRRVIEFRPSISDDRTAVALVGLMMALVAVHWLVLGRVPVVAAFAVDNVTQAALIRDSIHRTGVPLLGYIPSFTIWSGIPFLGIYFIHRRRYKLSWLVLLIGFVYALSLMQKSYPLIALAPPALYCLLTGRLIRMASISAIAVVGVLFLFFVANPYLRPALPGPEAAAPAECAAAPDTQNSQTCSSDQLARAPAPQKLEAIAGVATTSLLDRVFFLPGDVVARWFSTFPAKLDYEKGCGYRFVAPFLRCDFKNNPERLYAFYYPEEYNAGVKGTYNAAHFAEEYANFGPIGLLLSGIFAAAALACAAIATSRAGLPAVVALNLAAIMALTSAALHTTLMTGGWLLMMILTYILYPPAADFPRASSNVVEKTSA